MKRNMLLVLLIVLCLVSLCTLGAQAKTVCDNETGTHNGYTYELWSDGIGSVCMTLNEGSAFSCEWNEIGNMIARQGSRFDRTRMHQEIGTISVNFMCAFQPGNDSLLGVYGWTTDPLVEYYIVESWGNVRPSGTEFIGTITVDGGIYDIYVTICQYGMLYGDFSYYRRIWSVRRSKRPCGTVSVSEHFNQWESMELTLGYLYEVSLLVEGYESSGNAYVYYMSVDISNDDYTEITAPFVQDGAGSYYWKTTSVPNYIISWNLDSLIINGVDFTNTWVNASNLPDKQDGYYFIDYKASFFWGHVEIK